jgi:hypothetical protein
MDIGDGWYANGRTEAVTCPLKLGSFVGHHFVTLYGYDETYIYDGADQGAESSY